MLTNLVTIIWQMVQGFLAVVVPGLAVIGAANTPAADVPPAPAPIVVPSTVAPPADPWAALDIPEPAPAPEPTYVAPEPTYVAPEPTYVAPEPVYVAPEPVTVAPSHDECMRVADGIVADGWTGSATESACFPGGEWDPAIEDAYGELEMRDAPADVETFTTDDVRKCTEEDGTDRGCFWDSRTQGNGQGWSFYVDQDGGITYATDSDYIPAGKSPADRPADVPAPSTGSDR